MYHIPGIRNLDQYDLNNEFIIYLCWNNLPAHILDLGIPCSLSLIYFFKGKILKKKTNQFLLHSGGGSSHLFSDLSSFIYHTLHCSLVIYWFWEVLVRLHFFFKSEAKWLILYFIQKYEKDPSYIFTFKYQQTLIWFIIVIMKNAFEVDKPIAVASEVWTTLIYFMFLQF